MRWWRRKPQAPQIPPYQPPVIKPLEPKDPDYVVTEQELTQTGIFRLFPWKKDERK